MHVSMQAFIQPHGREKTHRNLTHTTSLVPCNNILTGCSDLMHNTWHTNNSDDLAQSTYLCFFPKCSQGAHSQELREAHASVLHLVGVHPKLVNTSLRRFILVVMETSYAGYNALQPDNVPCHQRERTSSMQTHGSRQRVTGVNTATGKTNNSKE